MKEWANIKIEKPENGSTVLVYAARADCKRGGTVYRAIYKDGFFFPLNKSRYAKYQITHWKYTD